MTPRNSKGDARGNIQEKVDLLGSLSSDVFERRTSTGSEVFSLLTCSDDIQFVFLSFFTVIEAIWLKICAKPPSKNEKRPLPVDVRRSETLLLKLPNIDFCPGDDLQTFYSSEADWQRDNLSRRKTFFVMASFLLFSIFFFYVAKTARPTECDQLLFVWSTNKLSTKN